MEMTLSLNDFHALEDVADGEWDGGKCYPKLEALGLCIHEEGCPFLTIAGENVLEAVMGCGLDIDASATIVIWHDEAFEDIDVTVE